MKRGWVHWGSGAAVPAALVLVMALGAAAPARAADEPATPAPATPAPATPAPTPAPAATTPAATTPAAPAPAKVAKPKKEKKPRGPRDLSDPWARGATWLSVRAGYARARYDGAAPGNIGYGFGFNHMFFNSWSLGGYAQYDVLGRFEDAQESELPFTLEAVRHLKWGSALHPYLGLGGGVYYHKFYRTGADLSVPHAGGYLVLGANTPVSQHGLIGLDFRGGQVRNEKGHDNPVFGVQKSASNRWSFKLNWSYMY